MGSRIIYAIKDLLTHKKKVLAAVIGINGSHKKFCDSSGLFYLLQYEHPVLVKDQVFQSSIYESYSDKEHLRMLLISSIAELNASALMYKKQVKFQLLVCDVWE